MKNVNFQHICLGIVNMSFIVQLLLLCSGIHPNPGPWGPDDHRCISICHANIRSLKHTDNYGNLDKLLHIKCNLANKFKIITLSETWLSRGDSSNDFLLPGYQQPFRRDRDPNNGTVGYGGVLAWVCNSIACKRRLDLEIQGIEAMWLEVRSINKKFFLCVVYRPPANVNDPFWDLLQDNINLVQELDGAKIVLVGDLNADPRTPHGKKLIALTENNNLSIHIKEPTRVTAQTQTILDQFITNIPHMVTSVTVSPPVSNNDHCTIALQLKFHTPKAKSYSRIMWDYKNANFDIFRNAIADCNWQECFGTADDVNTVTSAWTAKLLELAKSTIPNKQVIVRIHDKPWYNNILRQLRRRKDRLFKKAKCLDNVQAWERYKNARNEYFNTISAAKKEFDESKYQYLVNENNSSKKWWTLIKQVQKSNELNDSIPPLDVGGNIVTDDKEKANTFNRYFQKASLLDTSNASIPENVLFFDAGLSEIYVTLDDVIDQIKSLDTSKSYGPDLISPKLLKEGGIPLAQSICDLFNMSLRLCKVPQQWKMANIVPIHKKDEKNNVENYRPVSLLSTVGKVMERVIFKYTYNFFRDNFVISVNQSGFLPGKSTVTQLLEVYNEFCKAVDEGKEIRVIFLDISKAFDRVWHEGLLFKLKRCGIHGKLLDWFKDYLKDRLQRVVINGQFSEWVKILAGVPQGSVLGPLLFLIYIDDIVHAVTFSKIRLFADDTCLFLEVDDRVNTANLINSDLRDIGNWSHQWLVNFSPRKTKSLIISNKTDAHHNPQVRLFDQFIEEVDSHMYLGLRFSSNLRWKRHIHEISQSARKKLNAMIPLKYKLDKKSLDIMYRSFVLPTMEYANVVWGGSYDSDIMKLESIQIDALRLITGATARSNIVNLYEEVNYHDIRTRIDNASLIVMYKVVNEIAPSYLCNLIERLTENQPYNLRHQKELKVPFCRLDSYKRSFFPRVIDQWNNLQNDVKSCNSLEEFRNKLKPKLSDNILLYYYGKRWPSVHHA